VKPPKNRFQESAGKRALEDGAKEPLRGAALFLDVDGQVTYEGETPVSVTVFGEEHRFSHQGNAALVQIRAVTYQLVELDGKEQLVPASL
jgi:hypothetical protein